MLTRIALTTTLVLGLPQLASADRFYFGSEAEAQQMTGEAAQIEGVLLREENGNYVIRIVGGEVTLPKALVYRVEKTAITVARIEDSEKARARELADANERRAELRATEAAARRSEAAATAATARAAATEAPATTYLTVDFVGLLPTLTTVFDPIIGRSELVTLDDAVDEYLQGQIRSATR